MNSERVNEIRARWEAVQTPVVQGLKMPPMAVHEVFVDNADDDIAYLLAENARLQAVVEAAGRLSIAANELKRLEEAADDERNAKWDSAYEELYRANKALATLTGEGE